MYVKEKEKSAIELARGLPLVPLSSFFVIPYSAFIARIRQPFRLVVSLKRMRDRVNRATSYRMTLSSNDEDELKR